MTTSSALRRLTAMVGALAIVMAGFVTASPPATAADRLLLEGRGYGHGIGMSQHGAQGRAVAGHAYPQILAAYYPGTTLAAGSDSATIRVLIEADTDSVVTVVAESGMKISTSRGSQALPASVGGSVVPRWRIRTVGTTLTLEALVAGTWRTHGVSAITSLLSGVRSADVSAPDSSVRLELGSTHREFIGTIRAALEGAQLRTVVVTTMSNFLPSVVTSEMPSTWHPQALAAQAVAARSYALHDRASKPASSVYDTCSTTRCQVFNGASDYSTSGNLIRSWTAQSTRAAVTSTSGRYLAYSGQPAFTQFSASNGGYSVAGSRPYLVASRDSFDRYAVWTTELTSAQLERAYPAIGRFSSITPARDGRGDYGGRVASLVIRGTAGTVTVTGSAFRTTFGLRSTLFSLGNPGQSSGRLDLNGDSTNDLLAVGRTGTLHVWAGRGGTSFASMSQIGHGWSGMRPLTLAQGITAPGSSELLAVERSTGRLWAYPAASGRLSPRVLIGPSGWSAMDVVVGVVGFSGAGTTGVIARHAASGRLFYYPATGPGRLGAAVQIGQGWSAITLITTAGDWDKDGTTDLVARDSSGALWLYQGDGGGFSGRQQIGQGWNGIRSLLGGGDWTGDGIMDLIATDASGRLLLYPGNGRSGFSASRLVGSGWASYALVS